MLGIFGLSDEDQARENQMKLLELEDEIRLRNNNIQMYILEQQRLQSELIEEQAELDKAQESDEESNASMTSSKGHGADIESLVADWDADIAEKEKSVSLLKEEVARLRAEISQRDTNLPVTQRGIAALQQIQNLSGTVEVQLHKIDWEEQNVVGDFTVLIRTTEPGAEELVSSQFVEETTLTAKIASSQSKLLQIEVQLPDGSSRLTAPLPLVKFISPSTGPTSLPLVNDSSQRLARISATIHFTTDPCTKISVVEVTGVENEEEFTLKLSSGDSEVGVVGLGWKTHPSLYVATHVSECTCEITFGSQAHSLTVDCTGETKDITCPIEGTNVQLGFTVHRFNDVAHIISAQTLIKLSADTMSVLQLPEGGVQVDSSARMPLTPQEAKEAKFMQKLGTAMNTSIDPAVLQNPGRACIEKLLLELDNGKTLQWEVDSEEKCKQMATTPFTLKENSSYKLGLVFKVEDGMLDALTYQSEVRKTGSMLGAFGQKDTVHTLPA